MQGIDFWLSAALNSLVRRSWALDAFLILCASNFVVKGAWVVALYPWAWFRRHEQARSHHSLLIYGLIASLASVLLARILADILPFRQRPISHPLLHTSIAQNFRTETLLGWSSFPSDHATLFATLACVLMYVSRPIGILAFLYVLAVIDLPRIILGIHYPTDILAGTGLGVGIAALAKCARVRDGVAGPILRFRDRQPGLFYAAFSLLIFGIGTVFWPVLEVMHFGCVVLRGVLRRAMGLM